MIAAGHTETVDLGHIQGADGTSTWFGTVAATGFDSLVSDRVNRMSWPHGRMRYNVALVAEISRLRPLPFRMVLDGEREIVTDLTLAAFGNTRSYGGGMLICPGANHSDGLLDITMVHSSSRTQADPAVPDGVQGHARQPRRGHHRPGPHHHRRLPRHQRLRRRRLRLPAAAEISAVPGALKILRSGSGLALQRLRTAVEHRAEVPRRPPRGESFYRLAAAANRVAIDAHPIDVGAVRPE